MKTYPIFKPHFTPTEWTLPHVLEHQAIVRTDDAFISWEGADYITYGDFNKQVNRLAHGMLAHGVKRNERIVIFLPNSIDFVRLYFAANKVGAIQAPINTAYKGSFLEHQVNICDATTIVVADEFLERIVQSLPRMPKVRRLVVWSRKGRASIADLPFGDVEVMAFDDLYANDSSNPRLGTQPRDLAAVIFTSGTTGLSKGVQMSHAQIYLFSEQCCDLMRLTSSDTYMTALPLFHGNAQFLTVYCSMIVGGRCVIYERFSAGEWVGRLQSTGTTVTNCVGAMLAFIHARPPTPQDSAHKLRCVLAAPTPWELIEGLKQRFGIRDFVEAYGQTEINVPFMTPHGMARPRGAVGLLVDQWYEVQIVDPETELPVAEGKVGELLVRPKAPWILNQGYVSMPDKTLETWRNLWFHTGDAVRRDDDGWFYFLDRFKDTLRRRGENISSFEVETPIREHPSVADVAVVAVPADVDGGEDEVKACVVLKANARLTPVELLEWCDERMPYFVVPRYVEFMGVLPTSASEKVQKNLLRQAGVTAATWDRTKAGHVLKSEAERARRPAA